MFTTRQGLTIVYLSGMEEVENKRKMTEDEEEKNVIFSIGEVQNLEEIFERKRNSDTECVDILLTNQWPKYIEKQSGQQLVN